MQTRRVVAAVFASVVLAGGCTDAGLIDDSPAAAAPADAVDATNVGGPTAPIAPAAPSSPVRSTLPTPPPLPTLDEALVEEQFVPLADALERSGLGELIDGLDDFVLLAPTGTAFAAAGADVGIEYGALINTPQLLEAVIRYHIVADPSENESWRTLNGALLDVDGSDAATIDRVDGVDVIERIAVRNGVILVVPRLLLPGSQPVDAPPQRDD